jgi:hypothetical protein
MRYLGVFMFLINVQFCIIVEFLSHHTCDSLENTTTSSE